MTQRGRPPRTIRKRGAIAAASVRRTPAPGERLAFRVDPWTRRVIRPLLISALATSLAVGLLVLVQISNPDEPWLGVALLCWFAALEGTYTTAWLNNPDSHGVDRIAYRAAEVLLLIVLARLYSWVLFGQGIPSPEEMRLFLTAPLSLFAVGGFFTTTVVTLIAWWMAVYTSRLFTRLDVSVYEVQFYTLSLAEQKDKADDRPIQTARDVLLRQYLSLWLTVGMLMVILTALSTFEVNQFLTVNNPFEFTRLGLRPAMLYALLAYFLAGLWLLSHGRLLRMNARWLMDGVSKEPSLERGWQRSSLVVLLAIALLTAFLPIGSTLAISRILTIGLSGITYVMGLVFSFLASLFAALLTGLSPDAEQLTPQPTLPAPTPVATPVAQPPPPALPPNPFFSMIISSAFWALIIAIIIGSLLFFLRERGYRIDRTRLGEYRLVATIWLRDLWTKLTGRYKSVRRLLRDRLGEAGVNLSTPKESPLPRPRLFRLNALSPRDQIRYYYLALVRRAGEHGVSRGPNETPLEYIQELKGVWPEAEDDLQGLTGGFLDARYSRKPIEAGDVNPIKERWRRLKARLRARRLAE
jgi:hypothetical protein